MDFLLFFSLQKTNVIFAPNWLFYSSFPWRRFLCLRKIDFFYCNFPCKTIIFLPNWLLNCCFPCKRVLLCLRQIDYFTVVFHGKEWCYSRATLRFSLWLPLKKTSVMFAQNWLLNCSFPGKRDVILGQTDFFTVVFLEKDLFSREIDFLNLVLLANY